MMDESPRIASTLPNRTDRALQVRTVYLLSTAIYPALAESGDFRHYARLDNV
jgi:hypothetical protein